MLVIPPLCNIGGSTGFITSTICMIILGFASGLCQGTAYMMAAAFPPKYMAAVMFGNGVAGIGSNILRVITLFIFPSDEDPSNEYKGAYTLYIISFAVLALCAIGQYLLDKNPFAKHYLYP